MSLEEWRQHVRHRKTTRLSDDSISLIFSEKEARMILYTPHESDVAHIRYWINDRVESHRRDADPVYPPYRFIVKSENTNVIILGDPKNNSLIKDIEDLQDAVKTLGKNLDYISPEKTEALLTQLSELRLAKVIEKERKEAKEWRRKKEIEEGQQKHHKKYLRLAEKHGLDPNLIFANPESALKKAPTTIIAGNKRSLKTK